MDRDGRLDVNSQDRDETETYALMTETRHAHFEHSASVIKVIKLLYIVVKGDQRWQKTFTFYMIL